jgi:rhodanese-related sulfurtransferase
VTVLDVRQRGHVDEDPRRIKGSIMIPPQEVEERLSEIPKEKEIVALCA